MTIIDCNRAGLRDRLYVGDAGGQVWRVDIGDSNPSNWQVYMLASVVALNRQRIRSRTQVLISARCSLR